MRTHHASLATSHPAAGRLITPLAPATRWMLIAAAFLVVGAGLDLFVFSEFTGTMFAWAIDPPLTAAFLGANYLAAGVVEIGAARQPTWVRARVAIPAVMLFTTLTATLTALNLRSLDLANPLAWIWLVVYFGVPPLLGAIWWRQTRLPGEDGPREAPVPASLRTSMFLIGGVLLAFGIALLVAPSLAAAAWPWNLSPDSEGYGASTLTMEKYIGVWLLAWGTVLLHAGFENDLARTSYVFAALVLLGLLLALAAFRFHVFIGTGVPQAAASVALLTAVSLLGIWGWTASWRRRPSRPGTLVHDPE